jgi:AcrR family transcriptional regulator
MSTATAQPTRRDQIRIAAENLFRTRGYLATSMRDIASAMELSGGGSLYAHIAGKEDLLWEIARDAMQAFCDTQADVMRLNLPPEPKLRTAMITHVGVIMSRLSAAAVYFDEWQHLSEPRRTEFIEARDAYERNFQQLIHEGLAAGVFSGSDEKFLTLYVLGALNAVRKWYKPNGRLSAEQVAELTAETVLQGLRK